jgi:hypothetical protein
MNPWRGDRRDRDIDAGIVHERQHAGLIPRWRRDAADRVSAVVRLLPEEVWKDVVVNIDGAGHVVTYPP